MRISDGLSVKKASGGRGRNRKLTLKVEGQKKTTIRRGKIDAADQIVRILEKRKTR